jgi:hypothetical protein
MTNVRPTDGPAARPSSTVSAVRVLRRWEDSGAVWRVTSRSVGRIEISLLSCDAGEEMDRLTSTDPELLGYVGARDGSDQTHP